VRFGPRPDQTGNTAFSAPRWVGRLRGHLVENHHSGPNHSTWSPSEVTLELPGSYPGATLELPCEVTLRGYPGGYPSYPGVTLEVPRLPWSYPGGTQVTLELPCEVTREVTLELPREVTLELPCEVTLELPWSYPGYPARLPWRLPKSYPRGYPGGYPRGDPARLPGSPLKFDKSKKLQRSCPVAHHLSYLPVP
jgi:hypothetical protein